MPVTQTAPPQTLKNTPEENVFPRGLKIALIASALSVVLFAGLICLLMFFATDAQSTAKIKSIASSFMKIADPLPEGFLYTSGVDLLGTKMVLISQPQTGSVWTIVHIAASQNTASPQSVIHQIEATADSSRKIIRAPGKFVVRQKGEQSVGGRSLFYETGELISGTQTSGSLIGCFMPTNQGTTCIFGNTPLGKFDTFANDELMHTINAI